MRQAFKNFQRGNLFYLKGAHSFRERALSATSDTAPPAERHQAFFRYGADLPVSPLVISVPHAGREYPDTLLAAARVPLSVLRRLEDRHADALARRLIAEGHAVLVSRSPRALIDFNRDERDVDADMVAGLPYGTALHPGAKSRAGLGLLPRRLSGAGELWRGRVDWNEIEARISGYHRPYHQALAAMLKRAKGAFGQALLIDLHSMPPLGTGTIYGPRPPRIVVGDRFGRSASTRLTAAATALFEGLGFAVTQNHPYSGNYLLDRHSAPAQGAFAMQIEVDRSLYLDSALDLPGPGVAAMADHIATLAAVLADELSPGRHALAAE